ncbi:Gar1/Naf1 RNA binding region-domain-containing protein [Lyophyllum atratum]|nr:Gar1/Naf1 RNA binding region-domain-containing protein [Lyophyllum atratum]
MFNDEDEHSKPIPESDSSSDSGSESESDVSDVEEKISTTDDLDDDEESGAAPAAGTYFQTKNELVEADIIIPDISEVGPEEVLEKVGEIMTIMGNTVIVKGVHSELAGRGSERALDSDTLLVFEDRKVLGYIYETFGPTSQPLYQIKFNTDFQLNPERIQIAQEVFHVPARSNFVFLNYLKRLKGSDASNVHDEEPAENELEFSDDEAEAAYKASLKRKRGESRGPYAAASSRQSTPTPSQMHDQDMTDPSHLSRNPYDEHGPYDIGFSAGPSRPPPIPYDDPYADPYMSVNSQSTTEPRAMTQDFERRPNQQDDNINRRGRGRGQGRGRGDGRGRGRGRERGRGEHGGSPRGYSSSDMQRNRRASNAGDNSSAVRLLPAQDASPSFGQHIARPLSPTSLAIARATGQLPDGSNFSAQYSSNVPAQPPPPFGAWGYSDPFQHAQMFQFGASGYSQDFVQPHINPRFANAFGINMTLPQHLTQPPQYASQNDASPSGSTAHAAHSPSRADEWAVPSAQGTPADGSNVNSQK